MFIIRINIPPATATALPTLALTFPLFLSVRTVRIGVTATTVTLILTLLGGILLEVDHGIIREELGHINVVSFNFNRVLGRFGRQLRSCFLRLVKGIGIRVVVIIIVVVIVVVIDIVIIVIIWIVVTVTASAIAASTTSTTFFAGAITSSPIAPAAATRIPVPSVIPFTAVPIIGIDAPIATAAALLPLALAFPLFLFGGAVWIRLAATAIALLLAFLGGAFFEAVFPRIGEDFRRRVFVGDF